MKPTAAARSQQQGPARSPLSNKFRLPSRNMPATPAATRPQAPGMASSQVCIAPNAKVALVGVTGPTGRSALQGLLSVIGPGNSDHALVALSRNPQLPPAKALPTGVQVVPADLANPASLKTALRGADAVYCHALAKDARTADPQELVHAANLAGAAADAGVKLILYNSSGGRGCGYGISQMEQKHVVEGVLARSVATVALQATLFMEELWKRYTRPGILKGTFTWSTPGDTPIQMVAARDVGLAAGQLLAAGAGAVGPDGLRAIELAGDELSPVQMCEVFGQIQGRPVRHNHAPAWPFWFLARDVYRMSRFLTKRGFQADTSACREQFPGMLTFREFLQQTRWEDPARTFEDGFDFGLSAEAASPAGKAQGAQP